MELMTFKLLRTPNKGNYYIVNERGEPVCEKGYVSKTKGRRKAYVTFTLFREDVEIPLKDCYDDAFVTEVIHEFIMKYVMERDEFGLALKIEWAIVVKYDDLEKWVRKLCHINKHDELMMYQPYSLMDYVRPLYLRCTGIEWEYVNEWYEQADENERKRNSSIISYYCSYTKNMTWEHLRLGRLVRGAVASDMYEYAIQFDCFVNKKTIKTNDRLCRIPTMLHDVMREVMGYYLWSKDKDGVMLCTDNSMYYIDEDERHKPCLALDKIWQLMSSCNDDSIALGVEMLETGVWKECGDEDLRS